MDNQKDIKDISIYKGQNTSIKDMSFIKGRLEKLATAVFMVTDYIDQSEPLRTRLRTLVLEMLSKGQNNFYGLSDMVEETLSVMRIGTSVGLLSESNAKILISEFEKLKEKIVLAPTTINNLLNPIGNSYGVAPARQGLAGGGVALPKVSKVPFDTSDTASFRSKILDFIKEKGLVSTKDIASVITDCSEKTIQRELSSLVWQGVLKRRGEKRWARYSLNLEA